MLSSGQMGPLLALTTLLSWSLADLMAKYVLGKRSIWFVSFWGQLLGGTTILALGLITGKIQNIALESWAWVLILAIINVIGMFFFYRAIQCKGIALSLPIVYSWSVPAILLAMIFLNQYPSTLQWIGVGAAIIGLFLVSVDHRAKRWVDSGSLVAFISMLTWGLFYFLLREPAELYGEWELTGSLKIMTALLSLPFLLQSGSGLSLPANRTSAAIGLIGFLDALGLVAVSFALQASSIAIVTGITSTAPVVVACFGVLLFKEKINRQQTLGIATTTMGLMLLVI